MKRKAGTTGDEIISRSKRKVEEEHDDDETRQANALDPENLPGADVRYIPEVI
jgi:hypothetical protein